MASPLYFLPKLTRAQLAPGGVLSASLLARHGDLSRTLADVTDLRRDASLVELTGSGPGGSSGCILTALPTVGDPPVRLHYAPEFQTWMPAGPDLWIGTDNEHPVTAADLRRKKTFPGYEVELAGQQWTVPVIRDPEGGSGLPRTFAYDGGGKVTERLKTEYLDLWEKFARAVWLFFDPEGPWPLRMDLQEATDLCLSALSLNYRLGRLEQNLLGLIDSETWCLILASAVDYPTFRDVAMSAEAQKKTRANSATSQELPPPPESLDTSPGTPDGCLTTDPVGVNS